MEALTEKELIEWHTGNWSKSKSNIHSMVHDSIDAKIKENSMKIELSRAFTPSLKVFEPWKVNEEVSFFIGFFYLTKEKVILKGRSDLLKANLSYEGIETAVIKEVEVKSNSTLLIILIPILGVMLLVMLLLGFFFRHRLCKLFGTSDKNVTKVEFLPGEVKP